MRGAAGAALALPFLVELSACACLGDGGASVGAPTPVRAVLAVVAAAIALASAGPIIPAGIFGIFGIFGVFGIVAGAGTLVLRFSGPVRSGFVAHAAGGGTRRPWTT
jgi:hypothetical protein